MVRIHDRPLSPAGPERSSSELKRARAARRAPRGRARRRRRARSCPERHAPRGPVRRSRLSFTRAASAGSTASSCAASSARPTSGRLARRRAPTCPARRSCGRAGGGRPGPGTASTARAWPSESSPRSTIASTSSGSSSSRSLFEIAGFERPTRSDDVAERELELVHQQRVATRLLDRREILARDVLDQAEQQRVAVVGLADHGRHGRNARLRAPRASGARRRSARSRPRARGRRTTGWTTPCVADRVGEPGGRLVVEAPPRLARVRVDLLERDVRELGRAGAADQDLEAAAEAAPRMG